MPARGCSQIKAMRTKSLAWNNFYYIAVDSETNVPVLCDLTGPKGMKNNTVYCYVM